MSEDAEGVFAMIIGVLIGVVICFAIASFIDKTINDAANMVIHETL